MRIIRFAHSDTTLFAQAERIRTKVFIVEQLCPVAEEFDEWDETSTHYLVYCDETPAAYGRWRELGEWIKLERISVLAAFRGQGIARRLIDVMLNDTRATGKRICLNSQEHAVGLYEKHGFKAMGERFEEAGIPHYRMTLEPSNDQVAQSIASSVRI